MSTAVAPGRAGGRADATPADERIPPRLLLEPVLIAAALALAYLIVAPASTDLAAHVYRAGLVEREGLGIWNGFWYGGHHTPGYSVVFPPLAALVGPRLIGALAAVGAAAAFAPLAYAHFGPRARLGVLWFAAATATNLLTGRLPFALGVAIGLAALLAAQRHRGWVAAALAALATLASPIAGLFTALAGIAWLIARVARRRTVAVAAIARPLALAAPPLALTLVLAVAFPEGGVEPFDFGSLWPVLAFSAVALVLLPRDQRALSVGVVLYLLACLAAFAIDTPMGHNATRLGALFGGPVLACALVGRGSPRVLAGVPRALAVGLLAALAIAGAWWQWQPAVRDVDKAAGDPSIEAGYYSGLLDFLERAPGRPFRVEIPFTLNHWEAAHVAAEVPLARGWERQLDVEYGDPPFYDGTLTAAEYRRWLDMYGVSYVALPDVTLDYTAEQEAALIRAGPTFLRPVWSDEHWRVFRVLGSPGLASGAARLTAFEPDSFALAARGPGTTLVRARFTPYWAVQEGSACVERSPDGFTLVRARRAGPVRVGIDLDPARILDRGPRCADAGGT